MATVELISWTQNPIETIYLLWEASRHDKDIPRMEVLLELEQLDPALRGRVHGIFQDVIASGIPVAENVSFTFLLSGVSVALREQLVRHRVGVVVGDRVGMDIVPGQATSTFWAQSMRILNIGDFANDKRYEVPESLADKMVLDPEKGRVSAKYYYEHTVYQIQQAYRRLVEAGVPLEDARMLIPLGAQHRISWTLNLATLQHIIRKRGCWILQGDLWSSVIEGMVRELVSKVDPAFQDLVCPPCINHDKFTGCHFALDNDRRLAGADEIPPCPLYCHHQNKSWNTADSQDPKKIARARAMARQYGKLWGRDVCTGERK